MTIIAKIRKFFGLNPYSIPKAHPFFMHRIKGKPKDSLKTKKHEKEVKEIPQTIEDGIVVRESFLEKNTSPPGVKQRSISQIIGDAPLDQVFGCDSKSNKTIPQKIGDAPLDQVFGYDHESNKLIWKERPLHWFLNERVAKGWNTLYSGYCVNEHSSLVVSGKNIVYRLPKRFVENSVKEKHMQPENKVCPRIKTIATEIVHRR